MTLGVVMAKALLLMLLVVSAFVAVGTSAQASCAGTGSLRDWLVSARVVFVGTIVSTSDNDRVAHVRVESIWKGPDLSSYVDVHGSPVSGPFAASSIDRHFRAGERDLFVLYSAQAPLQDNSCSATQVYTTEIAALAPAGARLPASPSPVDQVQISAGQYWLPITVAVVVVAVAAFIVGRRLRRPR
jgi:hypothetical protein